LAKPFTIDQMKAHVDRMVSPTRAPRHA